MEPKKKAILFRRYMSIFELVKIISTGKLILRDPMAWEDEADKAFISAYISHNNGLPIKALCFTTSGENYHGWKVYAGTASSVCMVLYRDVLTGIFSQHADLDHRMVSYLNLDEIKKRKDISIDEYPFIKRPQYRDEKEYRVISSADANSFIDLSENIENLIQRVVLSPWLPVEFEGVARKLIKDSANFRISVQRSSLLRSPDWIKEAQRRSSNSN
jgi:hypothetical protein